jgi:hypothetical protein
VSEDQLESISSTKRVDECPPSAFLPVRVNGTSESAARGTQIHTFIADVLDKGLSKDQALLKLSPEYHKTCHDLDLDKIRGDLTGVRFEVAYALDLESEMTRELGVYLERAYPFTLPSEVRGSLDIEGFKGLTPFVEDIKTGMWVGPAKDNWQLRFFTTVLMFKHNTDRAVGAIAYVQDNGEVELEGANFTIKNAYECIEDLKALRSKVSSLQAKYLSTGKVDLYPGEHCKYCPVFDTCPAQQALVATMVREMQHLAGKDIAALTPPELSLAWVMYESIKPNYLKVERALKDIARFRGIELSDGRTVKQGIWEKREVNTKRVFALLRGSGVDEETIASCTSTVKIPVAKVIPAPKPVKSKKKK